jgi:hypothetical protein
MLAAIGLDGLHAPWVVDGAVNGAIFRYWVQSLLCPTLRPGDMVRWDNLSAHKVAGVEALLAARGARLLRLSPSAPDGNPIAPGGAQSQTCVHCANARTVAALSTALTEALDTVTATDRRGWCAHGGYPVH